MRGRKLQLLLGILVCLIAGCRAIQTRVSSQPALSYHVRLEPETRTAHVQGFLRGVAPDSVEGWGQQPSQYMAVIGRPDTMISEPEGIRFEYTVRLPPKDRDNSPDAVLDSVHFRAWGGSIFAIPVLSWSPGPIEVLFEIPEGWSFASTFAGGSTLFRVPSPQDLHASAFLAGDLQRLSFRAGGVQVELAVRSEVPVPVTRFRVVLDKLLEEMRNRMGPLPVGRVMLGADYRGVRKTHAPGNHESTTTQSSVLFTYGMTPASQSEFAGAIAHELSHMWIPGAMGDLVRAKSYDALGPFFVEGFTNYLAYRLAFDAGVINEAQLAERLSYYLVEFAFLASPAGEQWRGALPYSQGLFGAMILDIELMHRGQNRLYDIVRLLSEHAAANGGQGITPENLDSVLVKLGGAELPLVLRELREVTVPAGFAPYLRDTGITFHQIADPQQADREARAGTIPGVVTFDRRNSNSDLLDRFLAARR